MAQNISSLLITSGYDSSGFVSGMQAQVSASKQGAESALLLARALVQADAANAKSTTALVSLSKSYVDGYGNASRFEQQITRLTKAAAADGEVASRSGTIYEGLVRKFGLLADASSVLARGQPAVAAAIQQVNDKFAQAQASATGYQAVIERVAASNAKLSTPSASAAVQQTVNRFAGVGRSAATDNGAGYEALEAQAKKDAAAIEQLTAKYLPLVAAEKQHAQAVKEINSLAAEKVITPEQQATALTRVTTTFQAQKYAIQQSDEALKKIGSTGGLTAYQFQNLGFQVNDVITGLASGQPVMQIFTQQMGQIVQIMQGANGGVAGAFASIRTKIVELTGTAVRFAPLVAAITAVGTAALSANSLLNRQLESRQALGGGQGRFLGATPDALEAAAQRSAGNGVSLGSAREGILEGVRAGAPSLELIEKANALAQRYATTIGVDLKDAQKELAKALADPAKGAETLNEKLNFLDATTLKYIQSLQRQGQTAQAAKVLLDAVPASLVKQADSVTNLTQLWAAFTTQLSKGLEVAGRIATFTPPNLDTPAGARNAAQQAAIQRQNFDTAIRGEGPRTRLQGVGTALSDEAEAISRLEAGRERQRLLYNGPQTQAIVDRSNPAIQQRDNLRDDATRLQGRINFNGPDSKTLKEDQQALAELNREIGGYNKQLRDIETAGGPAKLAVEKLTQSYQAELETIRALTPAQKAAAAASTVKAQNFGTNTSPFEDAVQQQIASERVLAQAQHDTTERMKARDISFQSTIRSTVAFTIAEKAAAAGENAFAQTLNETKNATEAAQAARQASNVVLTQAAVAMRDTLREQQQAIGIQQIEYDYLNKNSDARDKAITRRQAENTLINQGRNLLDADSQAYIANASAIASNSANLARAKSEQEAYAQAVQRSAEALRAQGRDAANAEAPMHSAAGTTRGGDWQQAKGASLGPGAAQIDQAERYYGAGNYTFGVNARQTASGGTSINYVPMLSQAGIQSRMQQEADVRKMVISASKAEISDRMSIEGGALSKQIAMVEEQIAKAEETNKDSKTKDVGDIVSSVTRPDAYADHNPEYFYRNGTEAYKESNPVAKAVTEAADQASAQATSALQEQLTALRAQQDRLSTLSELQQAGVKLSQSELAEIVAMHNTLKNSLSGDALATYLRIQALPRQLTQTNDQTKLTKTLPGPFTPFGGFATGGEFIVPGTGSGDRPYGINLTPGERVKVTPAGGGDYAKAPVVNQYFDVRGADQRQIRQSRGEWAQGMAGGISRAMRA